MGNVRIYNMNKDKIISVLKGAGIAATGAVLTYLSQWATSTDFGAAGPVVAAVLAVAVNLVRKWAEPKTEARAGAKPITVEARAATVQVGTLSVVHTDMGPKNGYGSRIYLDGKEMLNVKSVGLNISVDEVVSATIEVLV